MRPRILLGFAICFGRARAAAAQMLETETARLLHVFGGAVAAVNRPGGRTLLFGEVLGSTDTSTERWSTCSRSD